MSLPYINRELSWLEFNQRVLNEAMRKELPLLERVKFLAITASNLDEFFQVRVGSLMLLRRSGRKTPDLSGLTPLKQLTAIRERVQRMVADQYTLLNETLFPLLRQAGVTILSPEELSPRQEDKIATIFHDSISPLLTPIAVSLDEVPPVAPGLQVIIACRLLDQETQVKRYALVPIPDAVGRRISISEEMEGFTFMLTEDAVSMHLDELFPGETVEATAYFRVTRNSDIAVQDDEAADLAGEMEDVLAARRLSDTVRLEIPDSLPRDLAKVIQHACAATTDIIYRCHGPLALNCLMEVAFLPGLDELRVEDWPAQSSPDILPGESVFEAVARRDVMLFHPYESFEPVIRMIEEAADDPNVISIKQVLYRTARQSRIIDALIRAAENGKTVTVLVELKARFDEARNLLRAEELQHAGAQIVYGVKGLKTHAKICMIVRREMGRLRRYVHLGTGNYNEATARLYTDISLLTCRPEYGEDASLFFNAVTGRSKLLRFQRLVPAPTAMKPRLLDLIASEAERARQGEPGRIIAKVNSLQDPDIIAALYEASQAGVEIQLNVRGICCLKPGDPVFSKNIRVISVIDRYLEHARVFYFHHGGTPEIFIASADWMGRNLERRVELMVPIEDTRARRRLLRILETLLADNQQASLILPDGTSQRLMAVKPAKAIRAQDQFHRDARRAAKAREHERSMTLEPHIPAQ